jgi:spermidine synthase
MDDSFEESGITEITVTEISDPAKPLTYTGFPLRDHTSPRQRWIVLATPDDELLFIDNQHQSSKSDEYLYHETFVHSIMSQCISPQKVLILGGAEGCMAREVLKWYSVKKVVQVDWDGSLLDYFRNEGRGWNGGAYEDPRVQVICEEANYWLSENKEIFDVILIDLLDPTEYNVDFVESLIEKSRQFLKPGSAMSINVGEVRGDVTAENRLLPLFITMMKTNFKIPHFDIMATRVEVPSYLGTWCFLSAVPAAHKRNLESCILPNKLKYITKNEIIKNSSWDSLWHKSLQSISYLNPVYEDPKKLAEIQRELEVKAYTSHGC